MLIVLIPTCGQYKSINMVLDLTSIIFSRPLILIEINTCCRGFLSLCTVMIQSCFTCRKQYLNQNIMYSPLQHQLLAVDIVFYTAYSQEKTWQGMAAFINLCKAGFFITLIVFYLQDQTHLNGDIVNAFFINFFASAFGLTIKLAIFSQVYSNLALFFTLAANTNHIVQGQNGRGNSIKECVSQNIYVASPVTLENTIDEQTKKAFLNIAKSALVAEIKNLVKWTTCSGNFYSTLSLISVIYSIAALANNEMSSLNTWGLSIYVVVVGLQQIVLILMLLIVCLIPLACFGMCIYTCFCKPGGMGSNIQVAAKEATHEDIINVGGDCSICFQSISLGEKVYVLSCSQKHVFHVTCLGHWLRVKNTCPNCRTPIPMGIQEYNQVAQ